MRNQPPIQYSALDVARAFCVAAHCAVNQKRKYSGEDYFHHPEEVLQLLLSYDEPTLAMQVAALLHDVVEDTAVTIHQIRRVFGMEVAKYVDDLTEVSKPSDGNRAVRKKKDLDHLAKGHANSMIIKCADLMSNSLSIVDRDVSFAKTYLVEKLAMLSVMIDSIGDRLIWQEAFDVCIRGLSVIWPDVAKQYRLVVDAGIAHQLDMSKQDYHTRLERIKCQ